jgi:hypothetical protein
MSIAVIVAIVVVAVVLVGLLVVLGPVARRRRLEARRERAENLRRDAYGRELRAEREQAVTDERSARANQLRAEASQRAAVARREAADIEAKAHESGQAANREWSVVEQRHEKARTIDPDVDDKHSSDKQSSRRS